MATDRHCVKTESGKHLAFGQPLVPAADKINVRWAVLLESGKLIGDLRGASAKADKSSEAVKFTVPEGVFTFALQPFPGATQGKANWGEISIKLVGKPNAYWLLRRSPEEISLGPFGVRH